MRKYMETGFYVVYMATILTLGIVMMIKSKEKRHYVLFGLACVLLGAGDAFHLAPRAVGLFTNALDAPGATLAFWLGLGKLITSFTMTAFYVLLYLFVYKKTENKRNTLLDVTVLVLIVARIVLCAMPQNEWFTNSTPLSWSIYRNVPFTLLGLLVIVLCVKFLKNDKYFKLVWLAIVLSFALYLAVVFFAGEYPLVGLLMIPKTVCYIWIAFMGFFDLIKALPKKAE